MIANGSHSAHLSKQVKSVYSSLGLNFVRWLVVHILFWQTYVLMLLSEH